MAQTLVSPTCSLPFASPSETSVVRPQSLKRVTALPAFRPLQSRRTCLHSAAAKTLESSRAHHSLRVRSSNEPAASDNTDREDNVVETNMDDTAFFERAILFAAASITPLLFDVEAAFAKDREFGILEGRIAALVHPAAMGSLFLFTLWAGYLGWQWRRVRTIGDEISTLKQQIPATTEGASPSPLEADIAKLTAERKELVKGGFKDKHFNAGSILLAAGVTLSIGGCLNTFMRTGRLFPGPHLWAGAGITVLWALAAAMVPAMQKGNTAARNAHIVLNAANVLLFVWQIPTGLDIVYKVVSLPWL